MEDYKLKPIGFIKSDFKQKLGIPRQFGLAPAAQGVIEFLPAYSREEAFRGLNGCSHIWIHFIFHKNFEQKPSLTVRPPRLGGNKKIGVFATRSSFRPNPIGQSIVRVENLELEKSPFRIHFSNHDLLEGTPVLDIKPYLQRYDSLTVDECTDPSWMKNDFFPSVEVKWLLSDKHLLEEDRILVEQILQQSPFVAYSPNKEHRIQVKNFDIYFEKDLDGCIGITQIKFL